jgi:hypothetical protein
MWRKAACDALEAGRILEVRYHGFLRKVEVHAVGLTKDGHPIMRGWQIVDGDDAGGWKIFRLDEAAGAVVSDEPSQAPRDGYDPFDSAMTGGFISRL